MWETGNKKGLIKNYSELDISVLKIKFEIKDMIEKGIKGFLEFGEKKKLSLSQNRLTPETLPIPKCVSTGHPASHKINVSTNHLASFGAQSCKV